ncbi:MAG: TIGR00300 family protein [Gemmatimonadaceae bacterium]|nr:TIGR00300 family protein [Gemmatimonadaceae bacterium]
MSAATEILEAEGHLIDSNILNVIFDTVVKHDGEFEVLQFDIGRTNDAPSRLVLRVSARDAAKLGMLVAALVPLGCRVARVADAATQGVTQDRCAPEEFYSTTNHRTEVRIGGIWTEAARQRMDAAIVIRDGAAVCRKLRDLRVGDAVVCGVDGVRVVPAFRERDRLGFAFMNNDVSSERRVEVAVGRVAAMMRDVKASGGRIVVVAGPVVVHTGGAPYLCELIRGGFVDAVLAGNALAVHDIERELYGTSLGVHLDTGHAIDGGHRHHMMAINTITRAGGIRPAVEHGVIRSGVMYECVQRGVPFVLAGSIRDDGPLPDTLMDLIEAQHQYAVQLEGAQLVLMLSSMLHGIGVGNMLPSSVRVVAVDINPAVMTKLADRGSAQAAGLVTDVGLFLHQLAAQLRTTD